MVVGRYRLEPLAEASISPLLPDSCIYAPTCSTFFAKSLEVHGPIKGFVVGILRILRCSPLFMGGCDCVDKESTLKDEFHKFRVFRRRR